MQNDSLIDASDMTEPSQDSAYNPSSEFEHPNTDASGPDTQQASAAVTHSQGPISVESAEWDGGISCDPHPKRRRKLLIIGAVCIALVIAVAAVILFTHIEKREPGAWPDFQYLSTLFNDPDKLVEAVNNANLTKEYQRYNSNPDAGVEAIAVPIRINGFDGYTSVNDSDEAQMQFVLIMKAPNQIEAIGLQYANKAKDNATARFKNLLTYTMLLSSDRSSLLNSRQVEILKQGIADEADTLEKSYRQYDDTFSHFALNPTLLLNRVGYKLNELKDLEQSYGVASWEDGLELAIRKYAVEQAAYSRNGGTDSETSPIFSGCASSLSGIDTNRAGVFTVYMNASLFDIFGFSSMDADHANMLFGQNSEFSIICCRDSVLDSSGNVEQNAELSDLNKGIWEFGDGALPPNPL